MYGKGRQSHHDKENLVDSTLEKTDPTPNIFDLFRQFNRKFFWDKLNMVEVSWSGSRMTSCAGVCKFQPRTRYCQIRLSAPLLSLRPRKDLVETLLHEMIHAYLFMTNNNRDRDDHGPEFHKHMYRINKEAGTNISVYHTFHDEVKSFQTHVWRCNGPCHKSPPFFGFVRRACNRAPGPNDKWWKMHSWKCSGTFVKIEEPPGYQNKKTKSKPSNSSTQTKLKMTQPVKSVGVLNSPGSSSVPEKRTNAVDQVRSIWANKYPEKRKPPHESPYTKKVIAECPDCGDFVALDEMQRHKKEHHAKRVCPVCCAVYQEACLEDHLNICLEESMNEDFASVTDNCEEKDSNNSKKVACPLCADAVDEAVINDHIDEHLNFCFDKCTNEDFSDGCVGQLPSKSKTVACPICGKSVDELTVNSHIDECLNIQVIREEFAK